MLTDYVNSERLIILKKQQFPFFVWLKKKQKTN